MFYSRGIQETSTVFNVKKMPGVGTKKDTQTGAPRDRKNSKRSCSNFSLHLHPHAYMFVNSVHRVYKENGSLFCPRIDGHATTTTTWRIHNLNGTFESNFHEYDSKRKYIRVWILQTEWNTAEWALPIRTNDGRSMIRDLGRQDLVFMTTIALATKLTTHILHHQPQHY